MRSIWCVLLLVTGCSLFRAARPDDNKEEIQFEPVLITGDLELEKLNDEELFAAGTSYYAAAQQLDEEARRQTDELSASAKRATENFTQAARYFGRLADFFPKS